MYEVEDVCGGLDVKTTAFLRVSCFILIWYYLYMRLNP